MRKRWLRVVALLVFVVGGWALINRIWTSNGFDGLVVTPSGTPVQGAVVLATWRLREPRGGSFVAVLNLFETTTDSNGRFRIPGWGPRFWVRSWAYMDYAEPRIHVIHPRFVPLSVATGEWP